MESPSLLNVVLGNQCPVCGKGKVFSGIYSLYKNCSNCHLKYEKEPGYFLGAIVAVYFFSCALIIPSFIYFLWVLQWDPVPAVIAGLFEFALIHPVVFRLAKLIWLFIETKSAKGLEKHLK